MWKITHLVATDENGNYVIVENEKLIVSTFADSGRVYRNFELKETPPCLSVAIDDLIKQLADKNST